MALQDNALITVAQLQAMGLSQAEEKLEEKINLVSDLIEDFCGYPLRYASGVTELHQGTIDKRLYTKRRPIVALASVAFFEEDQDLECFKFPDDAKGEGWIYRRRGWPMDLDARDETGVAEMTTEAYPIEVVYSAGFWLPEQEGSKPDGVANLPARIIEAAKISCYFLLTNAVATTDRVKAERTAAGYSVEFADETKASDKTDHERAWEDLIPAKAQALLAKYRSV